MAANLDSGTLEETLLLDRLSRVEGSPAGYFAIHMHLSDLRASNRKPHFLSIARRAFDNLINNADAVLFSLINSDLVLLCREVMVDDIDPYIEKVRGLFNEDPIAATDMDSFEDRLATWYDLANTEDFAAFFSVATELSVAAEQELKKRKQHMTEGPDEMPGTPMSPMILGAINQKLRSTRISDLIRQQSCMRIDPKDAGGGEIVFREHFVAIAEMKERVAPDINVFTSAWLFQFLTETLDRRILAVMARKDYDELAEPISLNLNVSTVLSRDFQQFSRIVGDNAQKVVVEMQIIDIFADISSFIYARDTLQQQGYRVVADGLNPIALQFFDPALLKTDFIKIGWGPEFLSDGDDSRIVELREVIAEAGKDSVILARVDSEKAVKWGLSIGITRFQGYFIDKLVQVMSQRRVQQGSAPAKAPAKAAAAPAKSSAKPPAKAPAKAAGQAPAKAPVKTAAKAPAKAPRAEPAG